MFSKVSCGFELGFQRDSVSRAIQGPYGEDHQFILAFPNISESHVGMKGLLRGFGCKVPVKGTKGSFKGYSRNPKP